MDPLYQVYFQGGCINVLQIAFFKIENNLMVQFRLYLK